jgi:transcriptional antiterminator Rof (Rho-off)
MAFKDNYVSISCGDYETFEIACMDGYDVELKTRDGQTIVGKAVDLTVRPPAEFLVIRHDDGTSEEIRVDQVRYMVVLTRPCRFDEHTFAMRDSE